MKGRHGSRAFHSAGRGAEWNLRHQTVWFGLAVALLLGTLALPAQAQSGEPPSQTVHVVQQGETLFVIAWQYGVTVDAITHANGIADPRQVYVGQQLVIPGGGDAAGIPEMAPYVVQAGDTLASIARRYHTTWQMLARVNGLLSPNTLYIGQVIQAPVLDSSAGADALYVMRPGDTLFGIALRYGVSSWALAAANTIADPALLYPGQELAIPGAGSGLLPAPFASVEVQPLPVLQGATMIVTVHTTKPVTLSGKVFDQDVRFAEEEGVYYSLVGVYVFTEPGLYELELAATDESGQSTALATGIVVKAGRFGYERIDLPESRTDLLDPDIVAAERDQLNALRGTFSPQRFWAMPFQRPCVGTLSSYFGTHRAYEDGPYTSYHAGLDFHAPSGTPVYAPTGGVVIFAEPTAMLGNAIFIDHGWGLLTGYYHLSSIEAQVGQEVAAGDLIGRVGSTGLSTGAHLHWEMWVGGIPVDGLQWLEEYSTWAEPEWLAVGG